VDSQVGLHSVDGFGLGRFDARFGFIPKSVCVVPVTAAESVKKTADVLFRSISLGEGVENRAQAHREERGGFKTALMAQKVQLHKQFISQSPVER
jgi:hypothetical protein